MERSALLVHLDRLGLRTEGLGPPEEWAPCPPRLYQQRYAQFWGLVTDLVPEDENDEPFWMTEEATAQLEDN